MAATMRWARATSLALLGAISTIRPRWTRPRSLMMRVDSRLRAIFCAVPAVMRVDPARNSGPVCSRIGCPAACNSGAPGLLASATVIDPAATAAACTAQV